MSVLDLEKVDAVGTDKEEDALRLKIFVIHANMCL